MTKFFNHLVTITSICHATGANRDQKPNNQPPCLLHETGSSQLEHTLLSLVHLLGNSRPTSFTEGQNLKGASTPTSYSSCQQNRVCRRWQCNTIHQHWTTEMARNKHTSVLGFMDLCLSDPNSRQQGRGKKVAWRYHSVPAFHRREDPAYVAKHLFPQRTVSFSTCDFSGKITDLFGFTYQSLHMYSRHQNPKNLIELHGHSRSTCSKNMRPTSLWLPTLP